MKGQIFGIHDLAYLSEIKSEEKKKVPPSADRLGGGKSFRNKSPQSILRKKYGKYKYKTAVEEQI